jgi:hypothetical protein
VRHGKRNEAASEAPQSGVFKPLSSYRQPWNAEENVAAVSGVFRVLSEDVPSRSKQDLTTTTVYFLPSEATARTETAVTKQSEPEKLRTSNRVAENTQISENKASKTNPVTVQTSGKQRPVYQDKGSKLSKRNDTKNLDSSEAKRGESEPSGDITHHKFHPPGSVSEALVGNSSRYYKLDVSSSLTASEEPKGMHPAARDTGQHHGFSLSVVSQLSRASSPGTNSSSGSSYNFSSSTEATGDSKGLRETPMGSTTGLLPDNSSSYCQSKPKVSTDPFHVTHEISRLRLLTIMNWVYVVFEKISNLKNGIRQHDNRSVHSFLRFKENKFLLPWIFQNEVRILN